MLIKIGSDFSGVGAFDMALKRLKIEHENVFACDIDKYVKQTYLLNHKCNDFYNDVYTRPIPNDSLDIYMTSPPCQSFSLAGKREGENSDKGILFYNSLEFITKNKPRFFIFENVKGLISDNKKITFQNWCALLGGKSINGNANLFSYDNSVPYHIYWQVLNAKDYNIPQNRERVFIVGIRDDSDNKYQFPKKERFTKKLKDILEENVDSKYYLSEKMLEKITFETKNNGEVANLNKGGERGSVYSENTDTISCLTATDYKQPKQILQLGRGFNKGGEKDIFPTITKNAWEQNNFLVGTWRTHKDGKGFRKTEDNNCPTIAARAREDGSGQVVLKIITNTEKGYDILTENDSLNYSNPNSKTRRGRVGKNVCQTLDTGCQQGVINNHRIRRLTPLECFRAMDFNEDFKWNVSDSQAYKQAGNSICVGVLAKIIQNLPL